MDYINITDNKACFSYYRPTSKTIHTTFRGRVNYTFMKEHIGNVIKFNKENEVLGAVVDFSLLRGSFIKLFEHLGKKAQPEFKARGFNVQAFVVSDDLISTNVTKKLAKLFKNQESNVKVFKNLDRANEWILKETSE